MLRGVKCATASEIAVKIGATRKVVQMCLNRLAVRGVVEKRKLGKRAVIYCARHESCPSGSFPPRRVKRRIYRLHTPTRERLTRVLEILQRGGCVSVGTLMRLLHVSHTEAYHMSRVLLLFRQGVKMKIGKTAVLCRDRAAAEETIAKLRATVHRLAVENNMRYATPAKILRAALKDSGAYELLSRFVPLQRNSTHFPPATLTFITAILESLYGKPLRRRRGTVYVVSTQPRSDCTFSIIDSVDAHVVNVSLPDDLASALQNADVNEVVLQAIEQLLARYRP
jgi:hypothetical protein